LKIIKNSYLKFIFSILSLLLFIGISDQLIGRFLKQYYFKQKSGLYYRTTYAIDSTKADILIFGSSRANHHYVPEIFEDSLNMSFYNCGREGNFLLYNYAVFKAIVRRYTPKIVIFDINPDELHYDREGYDRLSSLLPYYRKHPEIRSIVGLKGPFEKFKLISEIYPYNSSMLTIAIGNTKLNKERKNDQKGYVPLADYISDTVLYKIDPVVRGAIDTNKVNAVSYIIKYCNSNKIRLIFIQSPMYAKVSNTSSIEYFDKLTRETKTSFWNFLNDVEFLDKPNFFQDQYHLNNTGAIYFSKLLVKKIKDI
jgi:hypothetical protein